eukprot:2041124-Karenia_brevis.AAC.1
MEIADIPLYCKLKQIAITVHLSSEAAKVMGGNAFGGQYSRMFGDEGWDMHDVLFTYISDGAKKRHGHWRLLGPKVQAIDAEGPIDLDPEDAVHDLMVVSAGSGHVGESAGESHHEAGDLDMLK